MKKDKKWESYEEVSRFLLNQFADEFEMKRFEGKQKVSGQKSGTDWEIDVKGVATDGSTFLIVECRRFTTSKLSQEQIGALAYRITDTGAKGGIIVSPLGIQEGAKKIADVEGIISVKLNAACTTEEYFLSYLNKFRIGLADTFSTKSIKDECAMILKDKDGNIIKKLTL
jgi:hypothetical protein